MPSRLALACACLLSGLLSAQPQTHAIRVNPDGSFTPRTLYVRSGDTVRWENLGRGDSIIPVTGTDPAYPALCGRRAPYDPANPNDLTGPIPQAPSGIFVMQGHGGGYREVTGTTCPGGLPRILAAPNGKILCPGGPYQTVMEPTWKSPGNNGVFIRLLWKDLNPSEGVYDYTVLRREMEQAVAAGKLFSLSIKAGQNGTPDWIFSTNPNGSARANGGGGVPRLTLEDDDDAEDGSCGNRMDLGNPTNTRYQQLYFRMLDEVARFIRSRADWFRALAYIKTSGANLVSEENRLPKNCARGCICNPQILAQDGYRPSKLLSFYDQMMQVLRTGFPGKSIAYALIQDGFPRINETGGYLTVDGASSDRNPLPAAFDATQDNMDLGQSKLGPLFLVSHNGVQPKPAARCNFEGQHPKPLTTLAGYWEVGNGCPNRWAVREGAEGQITGYQTVNLQKGVNSPDTLDSAMQNMWDNTDGIYMELYEEIFWLVSNTGDGRLPRSGKTLADWAEDLHRRRVDPVFRNTNLASAGVPFPTTFSKTVRNTNPGAGPQTLTYVHGAKCGAGAQEFGQIIIDAQPPAIRAGGVVTAGGFGGFAAVAPGSWIEIYGSNLGATTRSWTGADFSGANAPVGLDGTSVRIGGLPAFVAFVSPGQVNAQVPSSVALGPQPVTVSTSVGVSSAFTVTVNALQPGLSAPPVFSLGGRQYAVAQFPDGAFALAPGAIPGVGSRRARPGDSLTFYGVGFGPVTPPVSAGVVVAGPNALASPFTLNIGGQRANVTYSGLAPGAVGLYQFNIVVPQLPLNDATPVTYSVGAASGAQSFFIAVGN